VPSAAISLDRFDAARNNEPNIATKRNQEEMAMSTDTAPATARITNPAEIRTMSRTATRLSHNE